MVPGPVPLLDAVTAALAAPAQAHYGADWVRLYEETLDLLRQVAGTRAEVMPLIGSGTAGVDAALNSVLSPGQRVVVGVTGFHSQRLAAMARAHDAEVVEINMTWGEPIVPAAIDAALRQEPAFLVAVTHVETTTGVLNPVREIAQIVRERGALLMVDAVGSLGGVEFVMDEWGVDVCCAASQKCLGGAAGLAPIAVGARAWDAMEQRARAPRSWYLDLLEWRQAAQAWAAWHPYPVTMPTNLILALRAGLQALAADGLTNRFAYYRALAGRLRHGLRELNLAPLVADEYAAPVVTAVCAPPGIPSNDIVAFLESAHDIKVSGGFGALANKVFRIGHMGPTITFQDIDAVLAALADFMSTRAAHIRGKETAA